MKRLYLFTSFFPYSYQESFLEDEIEYLSMEFEEVYVIPYCYDDNIRVMPANCKLIPSEKVYKRKRRMLFHHKTFFPFGRDLFSNNVFLSKVKFRVWLKAYGHINNMLNSKRIRSILLSVSSNDVVYFYWGKGDNTLAPFIEGGAKKVSRFHGQWDLWEEEYENYAPLRKEIMRNLDAVIGISKIGCKYLQKRYPFAKIHFFPLGSKDYGLCKDHTVSDSIKVLSCSTVYPLKRVDLIFRSLRKMNDLAVEWTHIGGGDGLDELKQMVEEQSRPHMQVKLLGRMNHEDVLNYIGNNKYDLFINLSTLEGVPVSIMEAISFDIPVVATNVGGTSDVVTPECGLLVSPNPSEEEVANGIREVLKGNYSPRKYWENNYSSNVNYKKFACFLKNL